MGRLDGRAVLITGGSRGQGAAEARLFVAEGASVAIADIREREGRALAHELGGDACFIPLDVTSEQAWRAASHVMMERFHRIDVLVNNAGISHFAALQDCALADYRRVIEVNQVGVFLGMRSAAAHMGTGGSIVNISSIDGLLGTPGLVAYAASKFAVRGMTKVAALELAPRGIRVNSIHPGTTATPMLEDVAIPAASASAIRGTIPMGRAAEPQEIAAVACVLGSEDSSYCTGAEFTVDGGRTAGFCFSNGDGR